jgi:hypothetical protein
VVAGGLTVVLATSAMSPEHKELLAPRKLLADQKGVYEHLYPRRFAKSTIRVVIMQGTQVATHYLKDQLAADLERDDLVSRGKMTREAAEAQAEEWAEVRLFVIASLCYIVGWYVWCAL